LIDVIKGAVNSLEIKLESCFFGTATILPKTYIFAFDVDEALFVFSRGSEILGLLSLNLSIRFGTK
jgi:hypothetical protein